MSSVDPSAKLKLIALDPSEHDVVTAQFNPKEVQIDRSVPWQKQKKAKNAADLEFTGAEPLTMSLELTFDGFEQGSSSTVQDQVNALLSLATVIPDLKRPPKVKIIWGTGGKAMPEFKGVIESVSTKYTMFAPDGTVLRATCNVKLKQADDLKVGKKA